MASFLICTATSALSFVWAILYMIDVCLFLFVSCAKFCFYFLPAYVNCLIFVNFRGLDFVRGLLSDVCLDLI